MSLADLFASFQAARAEVWFALALVIGLVVLAMLRAAKGIAQGSGPWLGLAMAAGMVPMIWGLRFEEAFLHSGGDAVAVLTGVILGSLLALAGLMPLASRLGADSLPGILSRGARTPWPGALAALVLALGLAFVLAAEARVLASAFPSIGRKAAFAVGLVPLFLGVLAIVLGGRRGALTLASAMMVLLLLGAVGPVLWASAALAGVPFPPVTVFGLLADIEAMAPSEAILSGFGSATAPDLSVADRFEQGGSALLLGGSALLMALSLPGALLGARSSGRSADRAAFWAILTIAALLACAPFIAVGWRYLILFEQAPNPARLPDLGARGALIAALGGSQWTQVWLLGAHLAGATAMSAIALAQAGVSLSSDYLARLRPPSQTDAMALAVMDPAMMNAERASGDDGWMRVFSVLVALLSIGILWLIPGPGLFLTQAGLSIVAGGVLVPALIVLFSAPVSDARILVGIVAGTLSAGAISLTALLAQPAPGAFSLLWAFRDLALSHFAVPVACLIAAIAMMMARAITGERRSCSSPR
ncbi:MAG: hypothetical protein MRY63_03430 [Neomegalonema sp.]|nr:hypothetical protein [Neomegalonema sp.]